ncbi:hypothetical protein [Pseudomonas koreensis]|uniref:type II toxin-antitoxin system RelB family antitoxin n=1 Tax=Pseudomonas koreensis TaxID=198620 RepID=UPI003C6E97AF
MDPLFSTTVPDFESEEQAARYDRWFRAEAQKSLDDPRPSSPNEQVMAEMKALMAELRIKHEAREALRKEAPTPHIDRSTFCTETIKTQDLDHMELHD